MLLTCCVYLFFVNLNWTTEYDCGAWHKQRDAYAQQWMKSGCGWRLCDHRARSYIDTSVFIRFANEWTTKINRKLREWFMISLFSFSTLMVNSLKMAGRPRQNQQPVIHFNPRSRNLDVVDLCPAARWCRLALSLEFSNILGIISTKLHTATYV